jgi:hypothetical protein
MSFFDDIPPPQRPSTPEPRREPWRGTSEDTLGVPVPISEILARTEDVAVLVSGIVAFPAGFSFSLILLSRLNPPRQPFAPLAHLHPGLPEQQDPFRFGIGLADGTKVVADGGPWPPVTEGIHRLRPQGGGGGGRSWRQGFFFQPLPPKGPLHFVCEWPAYDIPESRLELDSALILDAAEKARPIWPEDERLPEPPERPKLSGSMLRSYGSASASAAPIAPLEPPAPGAEPRPAE